jgi:hypothetical protein
MHSIYRPPYCDFLPRLTAGAFLFSRTKNPGFLPDKKPGISPGQKPGISPGQKTRDFSRTKTRDFSRTKDRAAAGIDFT